MKKLALIPLVLLLACGDSDDNGNNNDAAPNDTAGDTGGDTSNATCQPSANDQGVGAACTAGGGQCATAGQDLVCTADLPMTQPPHYCTKTSGQPSQTASCDDVGDCGDGARCCRFQIPGAGYVAGCYPDGCAPPAGSVCED